MEGELVVRGGMCVATAPSQDRRPDCACVRTSGGRRALAVVLTGAVEWVSSPRTPREGDTKRRSLLTNNTVSLTGCGGALAAAERQLVG